MQKLPSPYISIISPVYQSEDIVDQLVEDIILHISPISVQYEIILVDDGSVDSSWQKIEHNCLKNQKVKGLKLSRNFGQHHAITAGLDFCQGEWVIVMDCDMQDRPNQFYKFFEASKKGFEVIQARRTNRKDSWMKRTISKTFYRILSYLTGMKQDPQIANFGMYHRNVVHAIGLMDESVRYFPSQVNWVGYKRTIINVEHGKRTKGKSTYSIGKKMDLALDILLSYSDKPLRLTVKLGLFISFLSMLYAMYNIVLFYNGAITVPGFASLIVSIWFLAGLIIFILGILGLYLAQVFRNVKNRPIYLVSEKLNLVDNK